MSPRPLIGITTQTLHAIESVPADLPASWVMNQRYVHAVRAAGGVPVLIPLLADDPATLRDLYDRLDGLLLPGGVDVDPAQYHTAPHPALGRLDADRDAVELELARWAVADNKPLLGLCRGLQVLNVALGGTLWQDIASERADSIKHDYYPTAGWSRDHLSHPVDVERGSRLGHAMRGGNVAVNSMHHQGIRDLGRGLVATAIAPDGLIEAAEGTGAGYAVAVQWHPEMFAVGEQSVGKLFEDFVEVAAAH
ncbi:MAG TPA: gamma-glutamyl-gamma-aminobutyrate hydrolase family protein [Gemmatimonadales bacterium]|jgi:putative glutamine amidotransferase|nr:gamma-glutamyl-gamma-aminobutyrate hydrolase family protein [Gemmatimonadales bacterium]